MIDNPDYKGEWKAPMIDNPDYKGPWEHPMIPNKDYAPETYAKYKNVMTGSHLARSDARKTATRSAALAGRLSTDHHILYMTLCPGSFNASDRRASSNSLTTHASAFSTGHTTMTLMTMLETIQR